MGDSLVFLTHSMRFFKIYGIQLKISVACENQKAELK